MKSTWLAGSALVTLALPAQAQSLAAPASAPVTQDAVSSSTDAGVVEATDIVVTGSRIVRDGYTAPTPVTVATTEDLQKSTPSKFRMV